MTYINSPHNSFTDEELIREAESSTNTLVMTLADRLETRLNEDFETEVQKKETEMVDWAVACFNEHAGEDHHTSIIDQLREATKLNKADMKYVLFNVIEELQDMDMMACNESASMASGDSF